MSVSRRTRRKSAAASGAVQMRAHQAVRIAVMVRTRRLSASASNCTRTPVVSGTCRPVGLLGPPRRRRVAAGRSASANRPGGPLAVVPATRRHVRVRRVETARFVRVARRGRNALVCPARWAQAAVALSSCRSRTPWCQNVPSLRTRTEPSGSPSAARYARSHRTCAAFRRPVGFRRARRTRRLGSGCVAPSASTGCAGISDNLLPDSRRGATSRRARPSVPP